MLLSVYLTQKFCIKKKLYLITDTAPVDKNPSGTAASQGQPGRQLTFSYPYSHKQCKSPVLW